MVLISGEKEKVQKIVTNLQQVVKAAEAYLAKGEANVEDEMLGEFNKAFIAWGVWKLRDCAGTGELDKTLEIVTMIRDAVSELIMEE